MAEILIIEDDALARITMRKFVETDGHSVAEAENGFEGLELCKNIQFDVVITDLIMPVMEGIETIREIKRINPEQMIIAVTGGGILKTKDFGKAAEEFGANFTLYKPFTEIELQSLVNLCLET